MNPYQVLGPDLRREALEALLARHVDLERRGRTGPDEPMLLIGAVDVLSGFNRTSNSRRERITPAAVIASAALPSMFRAVQHGEGVYRDGLYSQNLDERVTLTSRELFPEAGPLRGRDQVRGHVELLARTVSLDLNHKHVARGATKCV